MVSFSASTLAREAAQLDAPLLPRHTLVLRRLAYWASAITQPPFTATAAILLVLMHGAEAIAWQWVVSHLLLAVGVPTAYVVSLRLRGHIADIQLPERRQRLRPYLFAIACMLCSAALMHLGRAPRVLQSIALAGSAQFALMWLITLRWKISAHTASAGSLFAIAHGLLGSSALPLGLLLPLVGWSRVYLRRHDVMQVIAGSLLGIAVTLAALTWLH